jgi:integrase
MGETRNGRPVRWARVGGKWSGMQQLVYRTDGEAPLEKGQKGPLASEYELVKPEEFRQSGRDRNGRLVWAYARGKQAAVEALRDRHNADRSLRPKQRGAADKGKITLASFVDRINYLNQAHLSEGSKEQYRRRFDHARPYLGGMELRDITVDSLEDAYRAMEDAGVGAPTIRKVHTLLYGILDKAVGRQEIHGNPAAHVDLEGILGKPKVREGYALTLEQVDALAGKVDERYYALVMLLSYTGLRIGEASALRVKRLHLDPEELRIDVFVNAPVLSSGVQLFDQPTKTEKGKRQVWIGPGLAAILSDHIARFSDPGPEAFVFTNRAGEPVGRDEFLRHHFKPAVKAAGLDESLRRDDDEGPAKLVTHDLRVTASSLMHEVRYPEVDRLRRLGQRTDAMTDIYTKTEYADSQRELAARLDPNPHALTIATGTPAVVPALP